MRGGGREEGAHTPHLGAVTMTVFEEELAPDETSDFGTGMGFPILL